MAVADGSRVAETHPDASDQRRSSPTGAATRAASADDTAAERLGGAHLAVAGPQEQGADRMTNKGQERGRTESHPHGKFPTVGTTRR